MDDPPPPHRPEDRVVDQAPPPGPGRAPADQAAANLRVGAKAFGAGALGVASGLGAAGVALVAFLVTTVAMTPPDIYAEPSEFDFAASTWRGVRETAAAAAAIAALAGALTALAYASFRFAASARRPRPAVLLGLVVAPALVSLAASAGWQLTHRADARLVADCSVFRFSPSAFAAADPAAWDPQARGLIECPVLEGHTKPR